MNRSLAVMGWLYAAILAGDLQVQAEGKLSFDVAVDTAGTESFVFGTELWAVGQIELLPKRGFGLETVAMHSEADRVRRLSDGEVEFALVDDDVSTSSAPHLRAVMAFWPDGIAQAGIEPTQLLVHRNVSEAVVYQLTRAIFEHAGKLLSARAAIGIGSPKDAIFGLSLPIHPGAHRYYVEHGLGRDLEPALTSRRLDVSRSPSEPGYVRLDNDEFLQLKAACKNAIEQEALDYFDGHDLAEICETHGVAAMKVHSTNLSYGQGGPKISAADGQEAVPQSATTGRDSGLKMRLGHRPMM